MILVAEIFLCILFPSRKISYSTYSYATSRSVFYECNKNPDLYLLRLILTPPDLYSIRRASFGLSTQSIDSSSAPDVTRLLTQKMKSIIDESLQIGCNAIPPRRSLFCFSRSSALQVLLLFRENSNARDFHIMMQNNMGYVQNVISVSTCIHI